MSQQLNQLIQLPLAWEASRCFTADLLAWIRSGRRLNTRAAIRCGFENLLQSRPAVFSRITLSVLEGTSIEIEANSIGYFVAPEVPDDLKDVLRGATCIRKKHPKDRRTPVPHFDAAKRDVVLSLRAFDHCR
jgi:hypothetical protein